MLTSTKFNADEYGEGWEVRLEITRETGPAAVIDEEQYAAFDESAYAIKVIASADNLRELAARFAAAVVVAEDALASQNSRDE